MGRDFLKEHLLWQIMDGESVLIWEDKWIPGLVKKRIEHPGIVESQLPVKVVEILDREAEEWKLDAIENWLTKEEHEAIKECQYASKGEMML